MSFADKALIVISCLILAFSLGRYSKRVDSAKTTVIQVDKQQDKEQHKVVKTTKQPDGTTVTETTTDTSTKTNQTSNKSTETMNKSKATLNISGLIANDFRETFRPVYGISVTKEILGPLTIGAFGLTNQTVGISIGINF